MLLVTCKSGQKGGHFSSLMGQKKYLHLEDFSLLAGRLSLVTPRKPPLHAPPLASDFEFSDLDPGAEDETGFFGESEPFRLFETVEVTVVEAVDEALPIASDNAFGETLEQKPKR